MTNPDRLRLLRIAGAIAKAHQSRSAPERDRLLTFAFREVMDLVEQDSMRVGTLARCVRDLWKNVTLEYKITKGQSNERRK